MPTGHDRSSAARRADGPGRPVGRVGRVGLAAALVVAGLALLGPPVEAQLPTIPTLPPLTTVPPDPATTTTTLLPPLVTGELLPSPGSTTPPPTLLAPLPTAPPARQTTTYKPPPVPPSTPARPAPAQTKTSRTTAPHTTQADPNELAEGEGLEEGEFGSELPFTAQEAEFPTGDDTMELGFEEAARDQVGTLASLAAGLIAMVLLGVALWLRSEVRRAPAGWR